MKRSILVILTITLALWVYAIDWADITSAVSARKAEWSANTATASYTYGAVKASPVHAYAEEYVKSGRKFDSTSYNIWRSAWMAFTCYFRSGSRFRVR